MNAQTQTANKEESIVSTIMNTAKDAGNTILDNIGTVALVCVGLALAIYGFVFLFAGGLTVLGMIVYGLMAVGGTLTVIDTVAQKVR